MAAPLPGCGAEKLDADSLHNYRRHYGLRGQSEAPTPLWLPARDDPRSRNVPRVQAKAPWLLRSAMLLIRIVTAEVRSAELHSAVSPSCTRQDVELPVCPATLGRPQIRAPQIANLRYGRVQLCATGLAAAKQTSEWEAEAYKEQTLCSSGALPITADVTVPITVRRNIE